MANMRMADVAMLADGVRETISFPGGCHDASQYLVARLFTDAVFNQDIRAIQLIINRVDGGLPKDTELDSYRTQFGDCLATVVAVPDGSYLKIMPDDTVMMALCKSLYDIATTDIYWDYDKQRKRRPSDAQKRDRDAAMRMVLERTGGRKTMVEKTVDRKDEITLAPWIAQLDGDVL